MSEKLEKQLRDLGNVAPRDGFKQNLRIRLLNKYENLNSVNKPVEQEKSRKHKARPFWRFGFSALAASLSVLFCMGGAGAYFTIPEVEDNINEVVGIEVKGELSVTTTPEDAQVFINNKYFGLSPIKTRLKPGNYDLRVEKTGFETSGQRVSVASKALNEVTIELTSTGEKDELAGWFSFISNNQDFGFRYPEEYKVSEQGAGVRIEGVDSEIDVRVSEQNEVFDTLRVVEEKLENGNKIVWELNENDKVLGALYHIESGELFLIAKVTYDEPQEQENDLIKETRLLLESIWFESGEQYQTPQSDVTDRFVWQVGDTVYSLDQNGANERSFKFENKIIYNASPDGKWLLYFDNGALSIMDTTGQNSKVLLRPRASVDDVINSFSLEASGWSPDSRKFVYESVWIDRSECEDFCEGARVEGPEDHKTGFYVFDLETGKSDYLKDSDELYIVKWNKVGGSIVAQLDVDNKLTIREYDPQDLSKFKDYSMNIDGFESYQFDIFFNMIVLRGGSIDESGIYTAVLENGKIQKLTKLADVDWTEAQWPIYSEDGKYIVFDADRYYDTASKQFKNYSVNNVFDEVQFVSNFEVFVVDDRDDGNMNLKELSIYKVDLNSGEMKLVKKMALQGDENVRTGMLHLL